LDDSPENVTAIKSLAGRSQVGKKKVQARAKRLSPRQKTFVEAVAQGKTDKDAALEAGFSESVAENTKAKLWSQQHVRDYYRKLMRAAHPPKRLVQRLSELVDGKSVTTKVQKTLDENGKTVESRVERTETVDAAVSLRAIERVQEIAGYVPSKHDEIKAGIEMQTAGPGGKEVRIRVVYSESPPKEEDDEEEEP
jgi:hypothetical protein